MVKQIKIKYSPRPWQMKEHLSMDRFTTLVIHRRAGKTVFAVNELIKRCLTSKHKDCKVAYIAPTYSQAKKVSWDMFKEFLQDVPNVKFNESELRINLPTGGVIYVLGAENYDGLRGMKLDYVVIDEVADAPEPLWTMVIRPALSDRRGGALFIGTPKGHNYFHELYMKGKSGEKNWKSTLLGYKQTNALDPKEIEDLKTEYKDKPEEFDQEYNCSFSAALKGAYFGKHMGRVEETGRITICPWEEDSPVVTAWDIGLDGTAVWYAQIINSEVRIIDYDFWADQDVKECLGYVMNKPYRYSVQYLPHDAAKRSAVDKSTSAVGFIKKQGLRVKLLKRISIEDRISTARSLLNKCIFNVRNCEAGIESLRQYRAKYDIAKGIVLPTEYHDKHSHPATAFCYLAQGLKRGREFLDNNHSSYSGGNSRKPKNNNKWKVF